MQFELCKNSKKSQRKTWTERETTDLVNVLHVIYVWDDSSLHIAVPSPRERKGGEGTATRRLGRQETSGHKYSLKLLRRLLRDVACVWPALPQHVAT